MWRRRRVGGSRSAHPRLQVGGRPKYDLPSMPAGEGSEDYLGVRGLERLGTKKWRKEVESTVELLVDAFHLDDVVLGGGNVKKLKSLPEGCRAGDNANAFLGGFRLWESSQRRQSAAARAKAAPARSTAIEKHKRSMK